MNIIKSMFTAVNLSEKIHQKCFFKIPEIRIDIYVDMFYAKDDRVNWAQILQ